MKNPIDLLKQLLSASQLNSDDSSLNFIGEYVVKKTNIKNYEMLLSLYNFFPKRDEVKMFIFYDSEDKIQIENDAKNEYEDLLDIADDELKIQIEISKSKEGVISVYDLSSFFQNFERKTFIEKINQFIIMIGENDFTYFDCFDSDNVPFLKTDRVIFTNYDESSNKEIFGEARKRNIIYIPETMKEVWGIQILPDWFHIISSNENPFSTVFEELSSLLSLFFVSRTAELTNNDEVQISFSSKNIDSISFSKEKLREINFFEIYDWVFENDAYSDKLILSQSIIEKNKNDIFDKQNISKLLNVIKESWNIYLMKNAEKYLKARNEIAKNINNTFKELSKTYTYLIGKFRSNIIAIFTFLLTISISNILSQGDLDKIFSYQITRIVELVFLLSVIFLFIAIYEVCLMYKSIKTTFDELKLNYRDVMDDDKELQNEFEEEKKKLKKTLVAYSVIWLSILVIIFLCFENITDYPIINMQIHSLKDFFINAIIQR